MKGTTKKLNCQEGGFLNFLKPLMATVLPLMKNVFTSLLKNVLVPLGLTAAASARDSVIQKKIYGYGTRLVYSNEDLNAIIKIVKSLEDAGLLIKDVTETVENKVKE